MPCLRVTYLTPGEVSHFQTGKDASQWKKVARNSTGGKSYVGKLHIPLFWQTSALMHPSNQPCSHSNLHLTLSGFVEQLTFLWALGFQITCFSTVINCQQKILGSFKWNVKANATGWQEGEVSQPKHKKIAHRLVTPESTYTATPRKNWKPLLAATSPFLGGV